MTASQAQAEARELSRLATDEFSALPRGIGDVHAAIAGRVFGALGPSAAPVRLVHDALSRGAYEGVRGGLWLTAHAAGSGRASRARRRAAVGDAARRRGDRRAQRPLRRPARGRGQRARAADERAPASASPRTPHVAVFVHGLGETEFAWGSPSYGERLHDGARRARRSSSASTAAATSPRTASRWPRCSTSWSRTGRSKSSGSRSSGTRWAGSSPAAPAHRGGDVDDARAPRGLARHAAHGRAARAGRARHERRAAPRARDAPVRPLPAPPQRRHPRPAPRLARRRGLARPGPGRPAREGAAPRSRCARASRTASSPRRSRPATSTRSAACSATRSC